VSCFLRSPSATKPVILSKDKRHTRTGVDVDGQVFKQQRRAALDARDDLVDVLWLALLHDDQPSTHLARLDPLDALVLVEGGGVVVVVEVALSI
jgi:hypothetical protein